VFVAVACLCHPAWAQTSPGSLGGISNMLETGVLDKASNLGINLQNLIPNGLDAGFGGAEAGELMTLGSEVGGGLALGNPVTLGGLALGAGAIALGYEICVNTSCSASLKEMGVSPNLFCQDSSPMGNMWTSLGLAQLCGGNGTGAFTIPAGTQIYKYTGEYFSGPYFFVYGPAVEGSAAVTSVCQQESGSGSRGQDTTLTYTSNTFVQNPNTSPGGGGVCSFHGSPLNDTQTTSVGSVSVGPVPTTLHCNSGLFSANPISCSNTESMPNGTPVSGASPTGITSGAFSDPSSPVNPSLLADLANDILQNIPTTYNTPNASGQMPAPPPGVTPQPPFGSGQGGGVAPNGIPWMSASDIVHTEQLTQTVPNVGQLFAPITTSGGQVVTYTGGTTGVSQTITAAMVQPGGGALTSPG
jgi:hypothetical protein